MWNFSFKKVHLHLKMSFATWQPFCSCLMMWLGCQGWQLCCQHKTPAKLTIQPKSAWIILGMGISNERWLYSVTSSLIGWAHTLNDPGICNDTAADSQSMSKHWNVWFNSTCHQVTIVGTIMIAPSHPCQASATKMKIGYERQWLQMLYFRY